MDQRQIFLRDILTTLFKRKLFIILFVVAVFALVFVGNYIWPPTYESMAKVQVTRGRGNDDRRCERAWAKKYDAHAATLDI